jgi:hypothetical protein
MDLRLCGGGTVVRGRYVRFYGLVSVRPPHSGMRQQARRRVWAGTALLQRTTGSHCVALRGPGELQSAKGVACIAHEAWASRSAAGRRSPAACPARPAPAPQFTGNLHLWPPLPPSVAAVAAAARALKAGLPHAGASSAAAAGPDGRRASAAAAADWQRAASRAAAPPPAPPPPPGLAARRASASAPSASGPSLAFPRASAVSVSKPSRSTRSILGGRSWAAAKRGAQGEGGGGGEAYTASLDASALLLRGCSLRNTEAVLGLVLYAGAAAEPRGRVGGWAAELSMGCRPFAALQAGRAPSPAVCPSRPAASPRVATHPALPRSP